MTPLALAIAFVVAALGMVLIGLQPGRKRPPSRR